MRSCAKLVKMASNAAFFETMTFDFFFLHTDLGHADPFFQQSGSLLAAQLRGPKAGRRNRIGQLVELTYGGPDRPTNVLPPFLIPLGPQ